MYTMLLLLLHLGCFEFFCLPGGLREHPGAYKDNGNSQSGSEVTGYLASAAALRGRWVGNRVGEVRHLQKLTGVAWRSVKDRISFFLPQV